MPIYYIEPFEKNKAAFGFDAASDPVRLDALKQARDTGLATATRPITLVQETQKELSFLVYLPVYRHGLPHNKVELRRRNLLGYVVGAFRIGDVMAASLAPVEEMGVGLQVFDRTSLQDDQLVFTRAAQAQARTALSSENHDETKPPGLQKLRSVQFAGRQWAVKFYPTREYLNLQHSWQTWSILIGGLLFTGALGAFLLVISGHTARVERLVEGRTAELARANLDRTDFTAMIAHDLRSPLMAITGVAELLGENAAGEVNEEQKKWLGRIQDNAQHMVQIVNDFLDVSQLESGRVHLVKKEMDLGQLVENCLNNVFSLAREKNISLKNACPQPLPNIRADGRRLEQVISNLLSNALKFTGAGGEISVGCEQANGNIITWVKDSGVGISGQELSWIFEKYRQTKSGQNTAEKGTGLGLAICKMIVEAHRGRIWAEGVEGKGAIFYFSLPVDGG